MAHVFRTETERPSDSDHLDEILEVTPLAKGAYVRILETDDHFATIHPERGDHRCIVYSSEVEVLRYR